MFQATSWRQFAAVDPDLNYLWWSPTEIFGTGPSSIASTSPATPTRSIETLLQQGRPSTDPADRAAAYQEVAKRLNAGPPLHLAGPGHLGHRRQLEGPELQQPHDAGRVQGLRHDRGDDLDPPDLDST